MNRPYQKILLIVALVWVIGTIAVMAWAIVSRPHPLLGLNVGDVGTLSVASGLVALLSILPGCTVATAGAVKADAVGRSWEVADGSSIAETPSAANPVPRGELSQPSVVERLGSAFLVGMMIRLAGTVALFLASSYYLDASVLEPNSLLESDPEAISNGSPSLASVTHSTVSATQIAAWVLGWHLLLLLTEVVALAREIQRINLTDTTC